MSILPSNICTVPAKNIIPFVYSSIQITSVHKKISRHGLFELPMPAAISSSAKLLLCGENVLLPSAGHSRLSYGCCAYLIADNGRNALPVIACRRWFQPPLPSSPYSNTLWADIGGGLAEAARHIGEAMFDLSGAVVAAHSWVSSNHVGVAESFGSALIIGPDNHVLCTRLPDGLPPRDAIVKREEPAMPSQFRRIVRLAA
jgi:hypothetical protein